MFEFSRNPKLALSVNDHFDECSLSQEKSVPTDRQTLSMHQYVLIESHCKASVAPWVHPFSDLENDLGLKTCGENTTLVVCTFFKGFHSIFMEVGPKYRISVIRSGCQ